MSTVASRDLRNHTADVLRQVADGTRVTVTVNGRPVAEIGPVHHQRPTFFDRTDLLALLAPASRRSRAHPRPRPSRR